MKKAIAILTLIALAGCESRSKSTTPEVVGRSDGVTVYRLTVGHNDDRYYGVDNNGNGFPLSK